MPMIPMASREGKRTLLLTEQHFLSREDVSQDLLAQGPRQQPTQVPMGRPQKSEMTRPMALSGDNNNNRSNNVTEWRCLVIARAMLCSSYKEEGAMTC